jgi:PilZ domain
MTSLPEPSDNVVRLIVGGFDGKLTTAAGDHVPVRVFERTGQELMVILMVAPEGRVDGDDLLLEYTSARGLVRLHGDATLEGHDQVCFRVRDEPSVVQRREFVRVEASQPVVLIGEEAGSALSAHAIELSGGGMLLAGSAALPLDASVRFTLNLGPGHLPISGLGHVVRVEGSGRYAVAFDAITHADRQRLIHFIFQRQRDALARGAHIAPLNRKRRRSES